MVLLQDIYVHRLKKIGGELKVRSQNWTSTGVLDVLDCAGWD